MTKKISIPCHIKSEDSLPHYASKGASGADLKANIKEEIELLPGLSICIPTGLFVEIPEGFEIQVRPRSGLALKHGITVLNTPGTIDADYRGEIGVILINHSQTPFKITPQMRIAQAVVQEVVLAEFIVAEELTATTRGNSGFGSTGIHKT